MAGMAQPTAASYPHESQHALTKKDGDTGMHATAKPWYEDFVAHHPGVQGGEAVLAGTRTPVRSVVSMYYDVLDKDVHRVAEELAHLSEAQIKAALAYYGAHRAEIDDARRRHEEAFDILVVAACTG